MLHSNYPKLITSKASVMDRFLMVQLVFTRVRCVLVILVTLASNIHMKVNEKVVVSVQLAAN